jgi:cobalamin synthase
VLLDLKVKVGCVGIKLVRTFLILYCHRLQSLQIRKSFALFFLAEQCIRSRSSLMAVLMTHFVYSQQTALTALKLRSHFVHELLRFNLAYRCRHRNNDGIFFHLFA